MRCLKVGNIFEGRVLEYTLKVGSLIVRFFKTEEFFMLSQRQECKILFQIFGVRYHDDKALKENYLPIPFIVDAVVACDSEVKF